MQEKAMEEAATTAKRILQKAESDPASPAGARGRGELTCTSYDSHYDASDSLVLMIRYLVGLPHSPRAGDWYSTRRHDRQASPGTPKVFCLENRRSICRLRRAGCLLGPPAEENERLAADVASFAIASCADTLVLCVRGGGGTKRVRMLGATSSKPLGNRGC